MNMIRNNFITVTNTSHEAILYNFREGRYYRNESLQAPTKKIPGLLYFITLPILLATAHYIEDSITFTLDDNLLLLIATAGCVVFGALIGRIIVRLLSIYTDKKGLNAVLTPCEPNEIVENYSLIKESLLRAQSLFLVLSIVYALTISYAIAVCIYRNGVFLVIFFALLVALCTFLGDILHPFEHIKYFSKRISVLKGHSNKPWLGSLLYRIYGK